MTTPDCYDYGKIWDKSENVHVRYLVQIAEITKESKCRIGWPRIIMPQVAAIFHKTECPVFVIIKRIHYIIENYKNVLR